MRVRLIYWCLLASLAVSGLSSFPALLRAQEKEGIRPDEMADRIATSLAVSTYFFPGEAVNVTGIVRNRSMHPESKVLVALFAGSRRAASQVIDLPAAQSTTLHFAWRSTKWAPLGSRCESIRTKRGSMWTGATTKLRLMWWLRRSRRPRSMSRFPTCSSSQETLA